MANLVSFKIKQQVGRGVKNIYSIGENLDFFDTLLGPLENKVVVEFEDGGVIEIYKDHKAFIYYKDHKAFTYQDDNKTSYYDSFDTMLEHLPENIKETIIFNLDIFRGL